MKKVAKIFILLCAMSFAVSKTYAQVSLSISVGTPPPEMPVYVQPPCPVDGYMWQPGYWAYDDADGYYWVPGVWVAAPQPGYLWTPAYWGYDGGHYGFHAGYWGLHVGFYGGINYGFGYGGYGYGGGRWDGGHFRYNTAVVSVNTTVIHNTYIDNTVVRNTYVNNHTSFNGPGGVSARPRPEEQSAMREQHIQPTSEQLNHQQLASKDRNQFASVNSGHPTAAAMNKVGGRPFDAQGHVATSSTLGHFNANRNPAGGGNRPANNGNRPANNPNQGKPANTGAFKPQPQVQQHNQPQRTQPNRSGQQPHPHNNPRQQPPPHEKKG